MDRLQRSSTIALLTLLFGTGCASRERAKLEAEISRLEREAAEARAKLYEDPQPLLADLYPAKCPVHGAALRDDVVPIIYGLLRPLPVKRFREDPPRLFPESNDWFPGGCCTWPGSPRHIRVKYCPECRTVHEQWTKEVYWPTLKREYPELVPAETGAAS